MATRTRKHPAHKTARKTQAASTTTSARKTFPAPPPTTNDTLRTLYASLLRGLMTQQNLAGRLSLNGAGSRQALAVATIANLSDGDSLTASHEDVAAMLARGVSAKELATGSRDDRCAHPAVPADPFIAGVGIALAHKLEAKGNVVLAICPQAAPALTTWHDTLQAAADQKLPIIFVIENGVSTDSPGEEEAPHLEPYSFFSRGHGIPAMIVDGDDVVATWRVAQEAIHRARNGAGPTLIDCRTHDGQRALAHMERYLKTRDAWDEAWKQQLESEIQGSRA